MVGESNQSVLLIQIDASSFAEFDISEFEIARVDCISSTNPTFDHYSYKLFSMGFGEKMGIIKITRVVSRQHKAHL